MFMIAYSTCWGHHIICVKKIQNTAKLIINMSRSVSPSPNTSDIEILKQKHKHWNMVRRESSQTTERKNIEQFTSKQMEVGN
jgi:hypothetical protein